MYFKTALYAFLMNHTWNVTVSAIRGTLQSQSELLPGFHESVHRTLGIRARANVAQTPLEHAV